MKQALCGFKMNNKHQHRNLTSKQYSIIREMYIETTKYKNNPFFGRKHTKETLDKISENNKITSKGERNGMYGVHRYGESAPMYGKTHSDETRKLISLKNSGKTRTPEQIQQMSLRAQGELNSGYGKIWINDGNTNVRINKHDPIPEGFKRGLIRYKS